VTHFREQRRLFDDSIYDLKIGTYHEKLVKVAPQQSLAEALALMHSHNLSALPVVDANDKILGVYSRSDITFLTKASDAEDAVANLDLKLQDVLEQQRTDVTTPDAMHTCSTGHTLQSIFEYFAQLRFNRLFVVDEQERMVGVVSAKDLVAYFVNE
jgi:5'-AMP-activated protein kinase regulatory gamma subunit